MKNMYLIQDKGAMNNIGLSYFELHRFFDPDLKFFKKDGQIQQQNKSNNVSNWKSRIVNRLLFAQVGIQSQIDYGYEVQRLAYIKSYQEVILIPNLHLNQVSLID